MNYAAFEQAYPKLLKVAENFIRFKKTDAKAHDLVNNAFLAWVESGEPFDLAKMRKQIIGGARDEISRAGHWLSIGEEYKVKNKIPDSGICSHCHELQPAGAFYIVQRENAQFLGYTCKFCIQKKHKEWRAKNGHRVKNLWTEANKRRYEKEKALLLDSYIVRLLKAGKKPVNPESIKAKRAELQRKRNLTPSPAGKRRSGSAPST